jgi:hypothetical protein
MTREELMKYGPLRRRRTVIRCRNDDVVPSALKSWPNSEAHQAIFLDHENIAGGEEWEERFYTGLRHCRALLALISPDWPTSPACIAQVNHAHPLRKTVIPLRVAEIDPDLYSRFSRDEIRILIWTVCGAPSRRIAKKKKMGFSHSMTA